MMEIYFVYGAGYQIQQIANASQMLCPKNTPPHPKTIDFEWGIILHLYNIYK